MFGIGIIGCGKIAQVRHIPEYAAHPEAKLVGFYDINQQRAAELAAKYGGRAYATVEELLAEPEIQAVSICAANFAHAELTIAALNAGKHVLCEKPMATNLADCEAMVQAADANGKFLMIGHNQRLAKAHSLARKLIVERGMRPRMRYFKRADFAFGKQSEKRAFLNEFGTFFAAFKDAQFAAFHKRF